MAGSVAGAALLVVTSSASAMTGNELLSLCDRGMSYCGDMIDGTLDGYDSGYIQGTADIGGKDAARLAWCAPENVTYGQVRLVVVKYLRDNPGRLHMKFSFLAGQAMRASFPCPK